MTPDFVVEANGSDITTFLKDRLLTLVLRDEAGLKSDSLELSLDDRDHRLPLPAEKTMFKVWLGYSGEHSPPAYMGRYTLDEIDLSNGPRSMTIRARAADLVDDFKAPKTRSWNGKTLGDIVTTIASEYGMDARINEEFADYLVKHVDQTQESDGAFLSRLAETYGAVAKPGDGKLIFVPWGEGKLANGEEAPVIALTLSDVTSWRASWAKRGDYGSATATYHDHDAGQPQTVKHDGGEGSEYQIRRVYATESEARKAAQAQYESLKSGTFSLDLTLPGRPDLFAECPLTLTDGFRPEIQGDWIIKSVTHTLNGSGYSCQLSAERKLP